MEDLDGVATKKQAEVWALQIEFDGLQTFEKNILHFMSM